MKEYIKIVVAAVIGGLIAGAIVAVVGGNNQPLGGGTRMINGLSTDSTAPSAGQVRTTSLTVTAASTFTGTSTVTQSVDGHVVGGTISTAATGTAVTVYTNSTGPKICDANTGGLTIRNNGSFSPHMRISVGTSTASVTTTNLIASTTIATSTNGTAFLLSEAPTPSLFHLDNGNKIMSILDDTIDASASSTYYGNLTIEFGVWCQDISI